VGHEVGAEELDHEWPIPVALGKVIAQAVRERMEAEERAARAQVALGEAALRLESLGYSRRDAAIVLGLSHQRVQQIRDARISSYEHEVRRHPAGSAEHEWARRALEDWRTMGPERQVGMAELDAAARVRQRRGRRGT